MSQRAGGFRRHIIFLPRVVLSLCCVVAALCMLAPIDTASTAGETGYGFEPEYDAVILNGRVVDPESRLDAIRNIGINNGRIEAISEKSMRGRTTVLATGLVVSPGFIDLHSHGQDQENYRFKARDGVTTALELEVGTADTDRFYADREGKALVNYGASIGHIPARMAVMRDPGTFLPSGDGAHKPAADAEIAEIKRRLEQGLNQGALGVGFGINYTEAASRWEILEMFRVAAKHRAPCFVHMRYSGLKEPTNSIVALEEVLSAAAITGAPLHVVHISSSGLRATPLLLQMIGEAQTRGLDVTTECYPYTATQTFIESAIYDEGWKEALGIDYKDLQWVATGERLTAESFARYRKTGGSVIGHAIPEDIARLSVASPLTMIASDGLLQNGKGHPRASGSYARVLGHYVRELKALTLMDALRKMTVMPAQRLERIAPMMKNKGRIRVGADADLTIFDPALVIDKSTFEEPAQYSEGITHVLVGGVFVVKDGKLQPDVNPGRAIRGAH
ncbi:MAG TPA: amidohydrolase family protein [Blastocatellia bacterium]|nr:amidohydrolase family protein [Blastocatellia bacterium]